MSKSGHFAKLTPFPFFPQWLWLLMPRNQTNKLCSPSIQPNPPTHCPWCSLQSPQSIPLSGTDPCSYFGCHLHTGQKHPPSACCPGYYSPRARDQQVFLPTSKTGRHFLPWQQGGAPHPFKALEVDEGCLYSLICGCSPQDASQRVHNTFRSRSEAEETRGAVALHQQVVLSPSIKPQPGVFPAGFPPVKTPQPNTSPFFSALLGY